MSGEQKVHRDILEAEWEAGYKVAQAEMAEESAALKAALAECVVFAQVYRNTLKRKQEKEPHSNGWQVQVESMNEIIDRAKKLIAEHRQ